MRLKSLFIGILASLSLYIFYFIIMWIATKDIAAITSQFYQLWNWIVLLSAGFGIQMGLFVQIKDTIRKHQSDHTTSMTATSATTSTVGMVACCAHHLTEILPIVGLSGLAIFLTNYQIPLIILGIIMNVIGIIYMLRIIKKVS